MKPAPDPGALITIPLDLTAALSSHGKRLDLFVYHRFAYLSRTSVQKMIRSGQIRVNDFQVDAAYKVKNGDRVQGYIPAAKQPHNLIPYAYPLFILYADCDIAAISKPPGMITHPSAHELRFSVLNALKLMFREGEFHAVHRLDRDTTGVLVIARSLIAAQSLSEQFRKRRVQKRYLALVKGKLPTPEGRLDMHIPDEGDAITDYAVVKTYRNYSLLEVFPHTGRRHQIRFHLAGMGFPILGDAVYGGAPLTDRVALHAESIRFIHPTREKSMIIRAPLPEDFVEWLRNLERRGCP